MSDVDHTFWDRDVVTPVLRDYLYELDRIEARARATFPDCTCLYIHYLSTEFMRYWRHLQKMSPDCIKGKGWDELLFWFNEKLIECIRCRLDLLWLIYEYDGEHLFEDAREPTPFWRK